MTEPPVPDMTLDCTGLACPLPILRLAARLHEVSVGEVVAVLADDAAAATDVPAWCRMRRHEFLGTSMQLDPDRSRATATPGYLVRRLH